MISLLEARKNVPLVVKSIEETRRGGRGGKGMGGVRDRGGGGGRRNLCRRFSNIGIREGTVIIKLSVQPFFGPILIRIGNCEIAVGRGMASSILVEEVSE